MIMNRNINLFIAMTVVVSAIFANTQRSEYVEGRLLAKFKEGITVNAEATTLNTGIAALDELNKTYRCSKIEPLLPRTKNDDKNNPLLRIYVFTFKTGEAFEELIAAYNASGLFEYVEPDYVTHGCSSGEGWFPNDQYFNRQWALHNDGTFNMGGLFNPKDDADIDMPEAWEIEQGDTSIIIAILDSGCKMDHPELAGRLWKNPGEIPDNGIDDDGNGYVDDVNGWDFVNDDNDPSDDNGHGTAMAGIIGANTNNEIGFAGVNPNARMMIVKVTDSLKNGNTTRTAKGIEYAVNMNANIINLSIVGKNYVYVRTEHEVIKNAVSKKLTIIAGAGNGNIDKIGYPAAYDETIAVGATGPDDKRYDFTDTTGSNYGPEIDMVAPGAYIFNLDNIEDNKYSYYTSGTSNATAYTTGVASILLSKNPTLTPNQIKEILRQSADDQVGDPSEDTEGWDKYYGAGRLNAFKALEMASAVKTPRRRPQITISRTTAALKIIGFIRWADCMYYSLDGRLVKYQKSTFQSKITTGLYIIENRNSGFPP